MRLARFARVRLLRHALPISLLILRKKPTVLQSKDELDCKTVRIFAYSSTREQSNKRSGTRLKTESETGERPFFLSLHRPYGRVRLARFTHVRLLRHALPISLMILRKKTDRFAV